MDKNTIQDHPAICNTLIVSSIENKSFTKKHGILTTNLQLAPKKP